MVCEIDSISFRSITFSANGISSKDLFSQTLSPLNIFVPVLRLLFSLTHLRIVNKTLLTFDTIKCRYFLFYVNYLALIIAVSTTLHESNPSHSATPRWKPGSFSASEPKLELGVPMPVSGDDILMQYFVFNIGGNRRYRWFPLKNCVMCASPFPFGRGHVAAGSSFFTLYEHTR